MCDFVAAGYLANQNAAADLWPRLLYLYSRSGEWRQLPMVQGEFVNE